MLQMWFSVMEAQTVTHAELASWSFFMKLWLLLVKGLANAVIHEAGIQFD